MVTPLSPSPKPDNEFIIDRYFEYTREANCPRFEDMSRAEQEDICEKILYYRNLIELNPLIAFVPNGQAQMVIQSEARYVVYAGGNGTQKTCSLANIAGNLMFGPQNIWFDNRRFRDMRKPARIRIIGTPSNISGPINEELRKWFPKGRYTTRKEKKSFDFIWEADNGSILDLMTYEQDIGEFAGATLDACLMDEPPRQDIWGETIQRFRQGGYIYCFFTPLHEAGFIYNMMEEDGVFQDKPKFLM